jgi:tRNA pseudouridine55 synthase
MNGVLLIDKPAGIASAAVVRRVKALVKPARVGHLGTLDPIATGVLPILIGEATKLAPFLEGGSKEYAGLIRLGAETDTLDREGTVVREAPLPALDAGRLREVAARFTGKFEQLPPVFSAIKRGGVPLYKLARRGDAPAPPPPRIVEVARLTLEAVDSTSIGFDLECSPGTYVRSLARDIGVALGSAAHLHELRRIRNGPFHVRDALALEDGLRRLGEGEAGLIGLREAIASMPEAEVGDAARERIRNGDSRALDHLAPAGAALFKVVHRNELIAVARATSRTTAQLLRGFGK